MHQNCAILCGCGGDFHRSPNNRAIFEAPRCAISSAKKIASEPRFLLRRKWVKTVLAAEFPAIPSSAVKIASELRCAILVHSGADIPDPSAQMSMTPGYKKTSGGKSFGLMCRSLENRERGNRALVTVL